MSRDAKGVARTVPGAGQDRSCGDAPAHGGEGQFPAPTVVRPCPQVRVRPRAPQIAGADAIPATGVEAVVLTVTVTGTTRTGYLG